LLNSIIAIFRDKPLAIQLFVIYFLGYLLAKILPQSSAFIISGYFFAPKILTAAVLTEFLDKHLNIILVILTFEIGLSLPWQRINLFRKRIYKTTLVTYLSIIFLFSAMFSAKDYLPAELTNIFIKPYYYIIFLFLVLLLTDHPIKRSIAKLQAKGPLSSSTVAVSPIITSVSIIIVSILLSLQLTPATAITNIFDSIITTAFILIAVIFIKKITALATNNLLFRTTVLTIVLSCSLLYPSPLPLIPLLTGIGLAIYFKNELIILPFELQEIFRNLLLFFSAIMLIISQEVIYFTLLIILSRYLLYKIFFYLYGKAFNFSEEVFRNIGGAILSLNSLAIIFLFILYKHALIELASLQLWISVVLLIKIIEDLILQLKLKNIFLKIGEIKD
jgi:hypothetical protein